MRGFAYEGPSVSLFVPMNDSGGSLEILVFRMADELDLPPRRVRGACARLLRSLRAANLTVERAEKELEEWMNRVA